MPSCLNRCSAVARQEPFSIKICLSNSYSLISLHRLRLIVHILIFSGSQLRLRRYEAQRPRNPQAIFCITGLQKPRSITVLILCCVPVVHRSNASIPPGFDFDIRRQTSNVDQAFGIRDCLFVEGGDPVASASTNPSRSASATTDSHSRSARPSLLRRHPRLEYFKARPLPMSRDSRALGPHPAPDRRRLQTATRWLFATGKTHVAGKGKLTSHTSRPPANRRYGYDRCTAQTHQHLGPWMQAVVQREMCQNRPKYCKAQKPNFFRTV